MLKSMSILNKLIDKVRELPENKLLFIMSFIVGVGSGLAAVLLKHSIHFVAGLLTSWFNTPAESILYILYPGLGMLLSLFFVKYFIKDNIGHGVTKVLTAVSKNDSRIKPHNMWSSVVSSSLTIGLVVLSGLKPP